MGVRKRTGRKKAARKKQSRRKKTTRKRTAKKKARTNKLSARLTAKQRYVPGKGWLDEHGNNVPEPKATDQEEVHEASDCQDNLDRGTEAA